MAFSEIRGYAQEILLETKIDQLTAVYRKAKRELVKILNDVDITDFKRVRSQALLAQVNATIAQLNQEARTWAKSTVPEAYKKGQYIAEERLKALRITKMLNYDSRIHTGAVSVLIDDVTLDLVTANGTIKSSVTRYIRQTQQQVLEDQAINRSIAQGLIQGETRQEISKKIQKDFEKQLKEGKLISIKGRSYAPESYSRLLARAKVMESSNQATVNSALQYGVDLVQVDVHSGSCPICDPYQGKIYSISGNDSDFPPLVERPPYHPNCRHVLLPITRESLEERGLLDGIIKFSNQESKSVNTYSEYQEVLGV